MCGRYCTLTEDEITEVRSVIKDISLGLALDEAGTAEDLPVEIAPTNRSPVIISDGGSLAFERAKFGFERWDGKGVIINARSETINQKPMFKNHTGRCVIPASGYFEWKNEGGKNKTKYRIKDRHGNLLFMAGLCRNGKAGREFVIITKNPVHGISDIHDRMPVLLCINQLESWLNGSMPTGELQGLDYDCAAEPFARPEPSGALEQMTLGH